MTLEAFNWWLAVGGGVAVPAAVGVVATFLVHRSDTKLAADMTASPQVRAALELTKEFADEDRVPA